MMKEGIRFDVLREGILNTLRPRASRPVRPARYSLVLAAVLLFIWSGCGTRQRPNIVFILADDLGWTDTGFMGSSYYQTPYLDHLAAQGMVFTQAYSPGPNCAPTRACILTGQYAPRHGVYTVNSSARGESRHRRIIPIPNTTTLAERSFTLSESLMESGYVCAHIGKWHLGRVPENGPRSQGFDISVAASHIGHPPAGYFAPYELPGIEGAAEGEYLTDRLTDEALAFIESHRDRPFFLYLSHYAVHTPLQAPEDTAAPFRARPGNPDHNHPVYAAMIANLDANIGRLLAKLDEWGMTENTLVVFFSDNGGVRRITSAAPLRGGKGMLYEGGIRVPMIVRWPGTISPGEICDSPVLGIDFFPTLLEAAGVPLPGGASLDGENLLPLWTGRGELAERALHWHFPAYLEGTAEGARDSLFRTRPAAAVRWGDWKLIQYFEDGALELYNLGQDSGERKNLAAALPGKTEELLRRMREWREKVGAPLPTEPNPDYDPGK
jgi:arylsulfatase A-like enzyme